MAPEVGLGALPANHLVSRKGWDLGASTGMENHAAQGDESARPLLDVPLPSGGRAIGVEERSDPVRLPAHPPGIVGNAPEADVEQADGVRQLREQLVGPELLAHLADAHIKRPAQRDAEPGRPARASPPSGDLPFARRSRGTASWRYGCRRRTDG